MKADSIHGQVAKKWNKTSEILNFDDLEELIRSSNKFNSVISLRVENFNLFESGIIQQKKDAKIAAN